MATRQAIGLGLLGLAIGACTSGAGEGRGRQSSPPPAAAAEAEGAAQAPAPGAAVASADAGPPLTEAAARALLSERFRAAGFRIRQDVPLRGEGFELTVDGYDPDQSVGFEYIAREEVDTDLLAAERDALGRDPSLRVLLLGAGDASQVAKAADAFLAEHPRRVEPE